MFTSRAEYRLRLRHDNADRRLTPIAYSLGLVDEERWRRLDEKQARIARVVELLNRTRSGDVPLSRLLRRPEVTWEDLVGQLPELGSVSREVAQQVVHDAKYAGYLAREDADIARQHRLAERRIPDGFDFWSLDHLRTEARERLSRIRPLNLAQAGRISGITPADLAVLIIHLDGGSSRKTK
jgi:tRNA uridine 5-carboxymethylaminomethyl modification enzyme